MMILRVRIMLAIWGGWALWQRARGRSPADPETAGDVSPPLPPRKR